MAKKTFKAAREYLLNRPLHVVLGVVVTTMLLFGLYLVSPFYEAVPTSAIAVVFDTRWVQYIVAAFYVTPGVLYIWGTVKRSKKLLRRSASWAFYVYTFAAVLRIVSVGFFPWIWLFILALGLIAAVIRLSMELRDNGG